MICGVTSRKTGLKLTKAYLKKNKLPPLDEDNLEELDRYNQTQGRNCNIFIEPVELNTPFF
jgi:hypothetical protein